MRGSTIIVRKITAFFGEADAFASGGHSVFNGGGAGDAGGLDLWICVWRVDDGIRLEFAVCDQSLATGGDAGFAGELGRTFARGE